MKLLEDDEVYPAALFSSFSLEKNFGLVHRFGALLIGPLRLNVHRMKQCIQGWMWRPSRLL